MTEVQSKLTTREAIRRTSSQVSKPMPSNAILEAAMPLHPNLKGKSRCLGRTVYHCGNFSGRPCPPRASPHRFRAVESCLRERRKPRVCRAFLSGRYWARTSDPQLVDSGQRSRQFAQVRSNRTVERNPSRDRTSERTRTNAEPCHPCHADETREPHLSSPSRRCCARVRPARRDEDLAPEASANVDVGDLDCVVSVAEPVPGWNVGLGVAGRVGCSGAE